MATTDESSTILKPGHVRYSGGRAAMAKQATLERRAMCGQCCGNDVERRISALSRWQHVIRGSATNVMPNRQGLEPRLLARYASLSEYILTIGTAWRRDEQSCAY
jgi:hypothetical protein